MVITNYVCGYVQFCLCLLWILTSYTDWEDCWFAVFVVLLYISNIRRTLHEWHCRYLQCDMKPQLMSLRSSTHVKVLIRSEIMWKAAGVSNCHSKQRPSYLTIALTQTRVQKMKEKLRLRETTARVLCEVLNSFSHQRLIFFTVSRRNRNTFEENFV